MTGRRSVTGKLAKSGIDELAREALRCYSALAREYYDAFHSTSRAFDETIDAYLKDSELDFLEQDVYLEVGCGKSRLASLSNARRSTLILTDFSLNMLRYSVVGRSRTEVAMLLCSAFQLPFSNRTIAGIFSFLGDPYATSQFFSEAYRCLKSRGGLMCVAPSQKWGHALRGSLHIDKDLTLFATREKARLLVPSVLYSHQELETLLRKVGFVLVEQKDLALPNTFPRDQISEFIRIPCELLGQGPFELPLITVTRAVKS